MKKKATGTPTCLSSCRQEIDHFLYSTRTMHVQRDVDQFLGNRLAYHATLLVRRKFQKFLTQVIAERIWYVRSALVPYLSSRAREPVMRSAKWPNVSRKIISRCSGTPSSSFFCKYRQPC